MKDFKPHLLEELKARFPAAIEDTYIQLDVARGIRSRPGSHREHIFDFNDRVRLIISKEMEPNGRLVIHCSGSISGIDGIPEELNDTKIHHIIEHWALVSGRNGEVEVKGITGGNVFHFYSRLDN